MSGYTSRGSPPLLLSLLVASIAVFAPVAVAHAAGYFVRADGSDANSGLANSSSGAWRTLGKANATLSGGDVVTVVSLNPADTSSSVNTINPTRGGSALAPIRYIGDALAPERLPVEGIELSPSYVVVDGFRVRQGVTFIWVSASAPGVGCVVKHCLVTGGQVQFAGAQHCRMSESVMRLAASSTDPGAQPHAVYFTSLTDWRPGSTTNFAEFDTLLNNTIEINPINCQARAFQLNSYTRHCLIQGNTCNLTFDNRGVESSASGLAIHESYSNVYRGNTWNFDAATAVGTGTGRWYCITTRSQTFGNLFENETYLFDLKPPHYYTFASLGQSSAACTNGPPEYDCAGEARENTFRGCVYKTVVGEVLFYNQAIRALVENCVFVNSSYPALSLDYGTTGSTFLHNTFYSATSRALKIQGTIAGTNDLLGNVFVSGGATTCYAPVEWLSAATGFNQDANLFYSSSGGAGSAIEANSACYPIGSSSAWSSTYGHDANSIWADPRFANASSVEAFDATPQQGSPAIAARFPNGYAGAIFGVDTTPPGAINNVATAMLSDVNLKLTWTAPGDNGTSGTAAAYDIRYSSLPITDANFSAAAAVSGLASPGPAGSLESAVITGLTPATTYYVSIKARDRSGNWSPLGKVLVFTTAARDAVPPANTSDFRVGP